VNRELPRPRLAVLQFPTREDDAVSQDRPLYSAVKRIGDVAIALLLLLLTAPLWLTAAVFVRLSGPGPVIFRQTRSGENGRLFTCYKFRTMVNGADEQKAELLHLNETTGPVFKMRHDPRRTPIGRWLRKTSIDELPQLLNVLKGDMSLVGPRPPLPDEVARYTPYEWGRLAVKPGLTCIWQVSGRSLLTFADWVALDLEYIRRRGFLLDLLLIIRTVPAVITGKGAL
jgi:lipopolysaccharide/colanic/teichoic acid biosynthesis glycosyltransferase